MLDLYHLHQLIIIAEAGTLSKAAEILLISQPALTRSMKKLEDELHVQLFDRKKNRIILNDNGELAVKYAKKVLNEADNMINNVQLYDKSKKTISIASCAPAPNWALQYIFKNKFPEMKITEDIVENNSQLITALKNNLYTVVVTNEPIDDNDIISYQLFKENLYISLPPAHPLSTLSEITFDELDGESILLLSKIGFWNKICLQNIPDSHLLTQNDESVFNELKHLSTLPNFITNITIQRNGENDNRVHIPISDQSAHVEYYIAYHKKNKKSFGFISKDMKNFDWKKTLHNS